MTAERLKGHLDPLLLAVLEGGAAHGYAVITRLRERSEGTFDLAEGTVYPALHRLERAGLLRSSWADGAPRRRRVYELTAAGAKALAVNRIEWRQFSEGVHRVLGPNIGFAGGTA
jgi:PadR family transcriptional regulator PadR